MKKLGSLVLACVGIISTSLFAPVHAETKANSLTFTAAGGYEWFSSKRRIQNATMPYVALGYNFTEHWGIEGMLSAFNTDFTSSVPDDRQIRGNLFAIDAVYRLSPYRNIEPYFLLGPGITGLSPNYNDGTNEGNLNAGVGALVFFSPIVALRLEARDFYTWVGGKNDYFMGGGVTFFLNLC